MSAKCRRLPPLLAVVGAAVAYDLVLGPSVSARPGGGGTAYFSLSRPVASHVNGGLELSGRACRLGQNTLLSPSPIRLEDVGASGNVVRVVRAYLPPIYNSTDQACSRYSTTVGWTLAYGHTVRSCFDRGRAC